ncbi:DUF2835 domain-containing protein [Paraneptunicella aestuarii]|uniref:DUF2835 family protein n=1 Tax=Paraneptunicella aestuarii TaxID=2831148 RepID=UPI001E4E2A4C|nr:DUF2835 family protein [Paraneptunicella aestuarii]UAA37152.1 DUF2835 domain-containing protein [Paraneptunicella aestuarii]
MATYFFNISLSYPECENLYQPGINSVLIRSESGERVQLPTSNLRPFVSRIGIKGRFRLVINAQNKVESFEKIA